MRESALLSALGVVHSKVQVSIFDKGKEKVMKKILGLDLDGVVYPWQKELHFYLKLNGYTTEKFCDSFWKKVVSGKIEYNETFWYNLVRIETLYASYVPTQKEVEALNKLAERYSIVYITNRNTDVSYITTKWLKKYAIPYYDSVFFVEGTKKDLVRYLMCDYFVDDRIKNILELVTVTKPIIHKQPYNELLWEKYPTIDSIIELPEKLQELESELYRISV